MQAADDCQNHDQMHDRLNPPPKPVQRSRPKVDAYEGGNDWVSFGVAESRGYRSDMQDMHAVHLDLQSSGDAPSTALFAVFDGHGGSEVAKFCADAVAETLQRTLAFSTPGAPMSTALRECMLLLDEEVLKLYPKCQGSTATLALLRSNELVVGGVGDSRCILARDGQPVTLTIDHKPTHPREELRIKQAGGFVAMGRVGADLNISRALGDGQYKENESLAPEAQMVSPEPDISQVWLDERDHWLLVASDGLWNSLKEAEVMKYIYKCLNEGRSLGTIAKGLTQACNSPSKSAGDNITVCIVRPSKLPAQPATSSPNPRAAAASAHTHTPSAPALTGAGAADAAPGTHGAAAQGGFVVQGAGAQATTAQPEQQGSAQAADVVQGDGVQLAVAPGGSRQRAVAAAASPAGQHQDVSGLAQSQHEHGHGTTEAAGQPQAAAGPAAAGLAAAPGAAASDGQTVPLADAATQTPDAVAVPGFHSAQQQQQQTEGHVAANAPQPAAAAGADASTVAGSATAMGAATEVAGVHNPALAAPVAPTSTSKVNAAFFQTL